MDRSTAPARDDRTDPIRQCVLSRRRAPQATLLRLVLGPDGRPFVDVDQRGVGRGVYVSPESLDEALSPKGLARAFRGKAAPLEAGEVHALVLGTVERLQTRVAATLGLARRAGALTLGMEAVCRRIDAAPAELVVVLAEDLAERSRRRVEAKIAEHPSIRQITGPTRAVIGAALGRETVGVAAVEHPVLGSRLAQEVARLAVLKEGLPNRKVAEKTRLDD